MEHEEEEEEEEELKLEQEEEEEHGAKRLFNPFTSIASPETMKKETSSWPPNPKVSNDLSPVFESVCVWVYYNIKSMSNENKATAMARIKRGKKKPEPEAPPRSLSTTSHSQSPPDFDISSCQWINDCCWNWGDCAVNWIIVSWYEFDSWTDGMVDWSAADTPEVPGGCRATGSLPGPPPLSPRSPLPL